MSRPPISTVDLSPTINISERHDGFWLWDKTQEMNLSVKAKTRDMAFVEALTYYQRRLASVEKELNELKTKVDAFLSQFSEEDESDY